MFVSLKGNQKYFVAQDKIKFYFSKGGE